MALAGCASIPQDRGLSGVRALVQARGGPDIPRLDVDESSKLVDDLLAQPTLSVEDIVRISLLSNPRLRADYARLGLSGAEVYDAGRLSNPTFDAAILFSNVAGNPAQVSFGLAQTFTNLLLLPSRSRLAKGEFERVKLEVGGAVQNLAINVQAAYYRLVSALQIAQMRSAIATGANASADLAQRFYDAGNLNTLDLELERALAGQSQIDVLSAENEVAAARSELSLQMGLTAERSGWKVSATLQLPVKTEDELPALVGLAQKSRLDLDSLGRKVALLEDVYGVTRRTRHLGDVTVGGSTERDTTRERITGPTISVQLPLFNQGRGSVLRAQARLEQARADLSMLQVEISNEVDLARKRVLFARKLSERYREEFIPLRERIVQRTQEQVNFMLVGQFELIRVKQQEYETYQKYLESLRDYWIARAELARQVGARLPSESNASDAVASPRLPTDPGEAMQDMPGMDHGGGKGMSEMPGVSHGGGGKDMGAMPGMNGKDSGKNMKSMASSEPGSKAQNGKTNMPGMKGMGASAQSMSSMPGIQAKGDKNGDASAQQKASSISLCDQIERANLKDPLMRALRDKCRALAKPGKGAMGKDNMQGMDHSPDDTGGK